MGFVLRIEKAPEELPQSAYLAELNHLHCGCCSVTKSCLTLQPMDFSTPCFPVLHYLPEFAQIHVP